MVLKSSQIYLLLIILEKMSSIINYLLYHVWTLHVIIDKWVISSSLSQTWHNSSKLCSMQQDHIIGSQFAW
jgi:hypothetical protein